MTLLIFYNKNKRSVKSSWLDILAFDCAYQLQLFRPSHDCAYQLWFSPVFCISKKILLAIITFVLGSVLLTSRAPVHLIARAKFFFYSSWFFSRTSSSFFFLYNFYRIFINNYFSFFCYKIFVFFLLICSLKKSSEFSR